MTTKKMSLRAAEKWIAKAAAANWPTVKHHGHTMNITMPPDSKLPGGRFKLVARTRL